jgi:hypothetical protein
VVFGNANAVSCDEAEAGAEEGATGGSGEAGALGDEACPAEGKGGKAEPGVALPIMAKTVPTLTVASSATSICWITPETGAVISVSILSVEISTSGSSMATVSPTFFNHRETVPSVTLSPRAGKVTGVDIYASSVVAWPEYG